MKRLLIFITITCSPALKAGTCLPSAPCQPGDKVPVNSASFDKSAHYMVTLTPAVTTVATGVRPLQLAAADAGSSWFAIPEETPEGTYLIQIRSVPKAAGSEPGGPATSAPSAVEDVLPSHIEVARPAITGVSPSGAFLYDLRKHKVVVLGTGFRPGSSLHLKNVPTPPQCDKDAKDADKTKCYDLVFDGKEPRQIELFFYALDPAFPYYLGVQDFAITVDGLDTNTSQLLLINTTEGTPRGVASIAVIVVLGIVFLVIRAGKGIIKRTFGHKDYLLTALFLDVPTSSYSLSKCQLYAWTAAAVFGYVFLAVSKSYVQGSTAFPDIPSGLPGILLASVGTTVLSNAISSTKGDKGAGNPEPNLSDFITSGGVVAPDRLQFVVWTIIGVVTFLAIVFRSDPREIRDLPPIPPGFLELMGISSAGYLGGKLARKPGPILDAIAISGTSDKLTFRLTGSALSRSALFSIGDTPISPDAIHGSDPVSKLPDVIQADPTAGDPDLARTLIFTITRAKDSWFGGTTPPNFTITNPDKQKATLPFQILKVNTITLSTSNSKLTITGECLDKSLTVTYTKAGGQPIPVSNVFSTSSQQYTADVEANLTAQVTVTVADTAGVTVTQTVTPVP